MSIWNDQDVHTTNDVRRWLIRSNNLNFVVQPTRALSTFAKPSWIHIHIVLESLRNNAIGEAVQSREMYHATVPVPVSVPRYNKWIRRVHKRDESRCWKVGLATSKRAIGQRLSRCQAIRTGRAKVQWVPKGSFEKRARVSKFHHHRIH